MRYISQRMLIGVFLILVIAAIPLTIGLLSQRQDIRKRAQCPGVELSARDPATGECRYFYDACSIPATWEYTPSCSPTQVIASVKLPGIGTDGNREPKNRVRSMAVALYSSQNQVLKQFNSSVTFNGISFGGTVNLGNDLRSGTYFIRVKLDNTLQKYVPENQVALVGTTFALPTVTLIPGDINNDASLDILDYNIFLSCYGEKTCDKKVPSDFDDNGAVEGIDYNILVRAFKSKLTEPEDTLPHLPNFIVPTIIFPSGL